MSSYKARYTTKAVTVFICAVLVIEILAFHLGLDFLSMVILGACGGELAVCFCPAPPAEPLS